MGSPISRMHSSPYRQAGQDHQAHRLGDGHEVPPAVRMRHGHRPAGRDLLLKIGTTLPAVPSTLPKRTAVNASGARVRQRRARSFPPCACSRP